MHFTPDTWFCPQAQNVYHLLTTLLGNPRWLYVEVRQPVLGRLRGPIGLAILRLCCMLNYWMSCTQWQTSLHHWDAVSGMGRPSLRWWRSLSPLRTSPTWCYLRQQAVTIGLAWILWLCWVCHIGPWLYWDSLIWHWFNWSSWGFWQEVALVCLATGFFALEKAWNFPPIRSNGDK